MHESEKWKWSRSVVSDSVRPRRQQPTRLPCPWDSPGKNTGVGCHFLLQCRKVKSESEVAQSCPTLSNPMDCSPPGSSIHGIFQARALEWGATARLIWANLALGPMSKMHILCSRARQLHTAHPLVKHLESSHFSLIIITKGDGSKLRNELESEILWFYFIL